MRYLIDAKRLLHVHIDDTCAASRFRNINFSWLYAPAENLNTKVNIVV